MKAQSSDIPAITLCTALIMWAIATPNAGNIVLAIAPTPTLGSATVLEGTFEFQPASRSQRLARYFIRTEHGAQEFHCGPAGARADCFVRPERFSGQRAKVWHTFWHGRIQHAVSLAPGERLFPFDQLSFSYQDYWRSGEGSPPWQRASKLALAAPGLALLFLLVRRYLKLRDAG